MNSPFGIDPTAPPPVIVPITVWPKQTAWSYSAVSAHAKCPLQFRFRRIDRYPEQPSEALTRGLAVHDAVAHYLTTGDLPEGYDPEPLSRWFQLFNILRDCGAQPEQQVAFRKDWSRTEWYAKDVFLRVVFDALHYDMNEGEVFVHEWKTGKAYPEHFQQMRLYCFAALKLHPEAKQATCSIGYLDRGTDRMPTLTCHRTTEKDLEEEFAEFTRHFLADDAYPARPGFHCRWCDFRKSNNGPCAHG